MLAVSCEHRPHQRTAHAVAFRYPYPCIGRTAHPAFALRMPAFPFGQDIAWRPSLDQIASSNLATFWQAQGLDSYEALQA